MSYFKDHLKDLVSKTKRTDTATNKDSLDELKVGHVNNKFLGRTLQGSDVYGRCCNS